MSATLRLHVEGDVAACHSFARINRELTARLGRDRRFQVSVRETGAAAAPESAARDVTLVHRWPPALEPPAAGRWVWCQPWEFGALPRAWVEAARGADRIWAFSSYVREVYRAAGFPRERVAVLPLGVDPTVFRPDGPRHPFAEDGRLRFLFVGGTIWRKGADVLLDAWRRAFRADDPVQLVVKEFGHRGVYRGNTRTDEVRALARGGAGAAPVVLIEDELDDAALASLYRACDVLVHPYRGEGFALPVAEAMACGVPAVVTGGGACDDFCDDGCAWRLPARRRAVQPNGYPTLGEAWVLEPDGDALVETLRGLVADRAGIARRAAAARARIASFTWDRFAALAAEDLLAHGRGEPRRGRVEAERSAAAAMRADAAVAHGEGRREEAARLLERAVTLDPWAAGVWSDLAVILWEGGREPAARVALRRALELDPADPDARANAEALGAGATAGSATS